MKIIKGQNEIFEVEVEGKIIGSGIMMEATEDDENCYLERLDIDEEHRNQGHGTSALYALRKTYGTYFLAPDNEDAQRLYERVADKMKDKAYGEFGFAVDQGYGVYEM